MKAYRYQISLKQGIQLGSKFIDTREGILIEKQGNWVEAAPLPHFSVDNIDDVIAALRDEAPPPPSLQFAFESLETPCSSAAQPVNALLQGDPQSILRRCRQLAHEPCSAAKLKVGRRDWVKEAELVKDISDLLRSDQNLRLDANRGWEWQTAVKFAKAISGTRIQYIEEPLREASMLEEFFIETGIPYALDESLLEDRQLSSFPNAAAYIAKPTLLGSLTKLKKMKSLKVPVIFSACYESGVGIGQLIRLAHHFESDEPAGFDTYSYLASDTLRIPLKISDWKIHSPENFEIARDRIQEIPL